jgi:hypothetical protein
VLAIAGGLTLLVALFMGPGMWSSDTEFLFARLWRKLRRRGRS